jgi:phage gp45-like
VGLVAELITVVRSYIANRNGGPGQTVYIEGTGLGKAGVNAEVYGQAGIFSRPPKGTRGVFIPIGRGRRYGIVLAMHNYQVKIDWTEDGETTVFSTTADGATVKARIDLKADGNIYLNGTSKYLVTWGALNSALAGFVTALNTALGTKMDTPGTPGALSINLDSAKATTLRTDG